MPRILTKFAALLGFVLHTPRTDLFAEGKAGKLTATSNAVCHESLKEYQQFGAQKNL
ncbi:MAG: hypothetical protein WA623_02690 [Candidatus Sulfotelmatobacter sp.]